MTEGTIRFKGQAIENREPHRIARLGMALVPERDKVFPNLTVAENLTVPVAAAGSVAGPSCGSGKSRCCISSRSSPACAAASAGCSRAASARCWRSPARSSASRELLLVDELSLGLAPVVVEDLAQRLLQIRKDLGIAIVLVEQSAAVALGVADHSYVMENGRIVLDGDSQRLRGHPDVQEFYLGQSSSGKRRSYRAVKQYRRSRRWYG